MNDSRQRLDSLACVTGTTAPARPSPEQVVSDLYEQAVYCEGMAKAADILVSDLDPNDLNQTDVAISVIRVLHERLDQLTQALDQLETDLRKAAPTPNGTASAAK